MMNKILSAVVQVIVVEIAVYGIECAGDKICEMVKEHKERKANKVEVLDPEEVERLGYVNAEQFDNETFDLALGEV